MGYKISYEPIRKLRGAQTCRSRIGALVGIFFLLFLLMVNLFWTEGKDVLRELVMPGDAAVTTAALNQLSVNLKQGLPVQVSVEDFCRAILNKEFSFEN